MLLFKSKRFEVHWCSEQPWLPFIQQQRSEGYWLAAGIMIAKLYIRWWPNGGVH